MLERKQVPPKLENWIQNTHNKRHFEAADVQMLDPLV
jgi:hypothetical protein